MGTIGFILGLYRDYRVYIGVIWGLQGLYWGYMGIIGFIMGLYGDYRVYIGVIWGL